MPGFIFSDFVAGSLDLLNRYPLLYAALLVVGSILLFKIAFAAKWWRFRVVLNREVREQEAAAKRQAEERAKERVLRVINHNFKRHDGAA